MDDTEIITRIFNKLDDMEKRMNEMCHRVTQLETIHEVTKNKFNQMMAAIGAGAAFIGVITLFT